MKTLFIISSFFAFCVSAFTQTVSTSETFGRENYFFVKDGVLAGTIYVPENCDIEDLTTAHDLANWISRVSGSKKSLVKYENYASNDDVAIYIGKTVEAESNGVFPPEEGVESFTIQSRGKNLFIVGKTRMATAHAVSYFLTKFLGIEFVFPGVDGAEWTVQSNISFPRENVYYVPAWTWRNIYVTGEKEWVKHLGFGVLPSFSHNLYNIFTPEICDQYPEFYPEINGRIYKKYNRGYTPQPNLVSPAAPKIAFEAAKSFFEKNPTVPTFSLGINDSTNWDESSESEAALGEIKYYRNLPDRSDYFYHFVNRTATLLAQDTTLSAKKIGVIAYLDVQNTPSFQIGKNVVPVLCADRTMWVFPKFKEDDKALMKRWANSGVETWGIYDYYYGNPFLFPRQFFGVQAESLKFAYEHGARLFFAEINPIVPFDAAKIWLTAKLLQNPDEDAEKILDRFFDLAYGNAKDPMKKFFKDCEKIWTNQGGQCRWIKGYKAENAFEIFTPEVCAELAGLLKKARAAFPQNPEDERSRRIIARIDATMENFARTESFSKSYFLRKELQNSKPITVEDAIDMMKNPVWRIENIYDDSKWTGKGFPKLQMQLNDPRPAAFFYLVDFIKNSKKSSGRSRAEEILEHLLQPKNNPPSADDKVLSFLRKAVPQINAAPALEEGFEPRRFRDSETGEWTEESIFKKVPGKDWRVGKTLQTPGEWKNIFSPSEKLFAGETNEARSGKSALKISGECELAQYLKSHPTKGAKHAVLSVWCRGNVSSGSLAFLSFVWKNKDGIRLMKPSVTTLSVGKTSGWKLLVVCGNAPENAENIEIALGASYQAPEDEIIFDDLSLFLY